jgi:putative ABC transport system permease protein
MLWAEVFRVALGALRANKLRSLLTMLGIVIGVSAVIAMDGIGRGAQKAINDRITALGTTLLTVSPGRVASRGVSSETDRAQLRMRDADALIARGTLALAYQPEMNRQLQVQYMSNNTSTQVVGTTANYPQVRKYDLQFGRMFTEREDEGKQRLAVLGSQVVTDLGVENPAALIGQPIRVRGIQFTVIGILASKGQTSPFQNPDDQLLIPLQTARFRVMGTDRLRSVSVLAPSEDSIPQTMADIQRVLRREHRLQRDTPDDFEIRNQADFLNTAAETSKVFGSLLAGIAAVSLLVGGIGIMNIMLVSVTERTREIGVRKALGATGANILLQFLIEAVVLCLLGGLIGVVLGGGGAILLGNVFKWNTELSAQSIAMAFVFSATVGVLFGVWPARRAAKLDPITALRFE